MKKIAKIVASTRQQGRYHVYFYNGEKEVYELSVSEEVLIKEGLTKGKELDKEEVKRIKNTDNLEKVMHKVFHYLSFRMRSEREIITYIRKLEVPEDEIEKILTRLKELDFVNDKRFAESFIETKKEVQKKGKIWMYKELKDKGIDETIIENSLEKYDDEEELEIAAALIEKKLPSLMKEGAHQRRQKLMQFLIQRGITRSVAEEAMNQMTEERDEDLEYEQLSMLAEKSWYKNRTKDQWEKIQKVKQALYRKGYDAEQMNRWIEEKKEEEMNEEM